MRNISLPTDKELDMSDKNSKKVEEAKNAYKNEKYREDGSPNSAPGVNTPGIELPAFNPPVPNRAWTEMRRALMNGDTLTDGIDPDDGEIKG